MAWVSWHRNVGQLLGVPASSSQGNSAIGCGSIHRTMLLASKGPQATGQLHNNDFVGRVFCWHKVTMHVALVRRPMMGIDFAVRRINAARLHRLVLPPGHHCLNLNDCMLEWGC